jgi:hypothetical protein
MPDDSQRLALAAITRTLRRGGDPTWTACAILTALRGLGWRPTSTSPRGVAAPTGRQRHRPRTTSPPAHHPGVPDAQALKPCGTIAAPPPPPQAPRTPATPVSGDRTAMLPCHRMLVLRGACASLGRGLCRCHHRW